MDVSPPPSPPDADDDGTVLAPELVVLLALQVESMTAQLITLALCAGCHVLAMYALMAFFLTNPGYRSILGVPNLRNGGFFETSERMMQPVSEGGKPEQFRRIYRMYPETFLMLEGRLWSAFMATRPEVRGRKPSQAVFRRRLMITLMYLATGAPYWLLSEMYGCTVDYRELLVENIVALAAVFILWPRAADAREVASRFSQLLSRNRDQRHGFARCLGAIDGSFVKILRPIAATFDTDREWNSYKKYYAIQMLVVAAPNRLIQWAHVGAPGSRADIWILKRSDLWRRVRNFIPEGFYLLGDSGFQLMVWLMIPFKKPAVVAAQGIRKRMFNMFNAAQQSARVVVENTFGTLKGRWRILHHGIQADLEHCRSIVIACIVLHNICIVQDDLWPTVEQVEAKDLDLGTGYPRTPDWMDGHTQSPIDPDYQSVRIDAKAAKKARDAIVQQLGPDSWEEPQLLMPQST